MDPSLTFIVVDALATALGSQALQAYFYTRLLDMRRPVAFFVPYTIACFPTTLLLRIAVPASAAPLGSLLAFAVFYLAWPLAASGGTLWSRVVTCILVIVQTFVCEVGAGVTYHAITGFAVVSYTNYLANPAGYVMTRIVHLIATCMALATIEFVLRRIRFGKFKDEHVRSKRNDTGTPPSIAFMAFQASALVYVISSQSRPVDVDYLAASANPALGLFAIAFLAFDLALILAIRRYLESSRELARAAAMQRMIEEEIESYDEIVAQVEVTAKLRHDLRNQLQVAYALHSRGETQLAKQHCASMSQMLSDADTAPSHTADELAGDDVHVTAPVTTPDADGKMPHNTALSAPWLPWAPIALQTAFTIYTVTIYAQREAPLTSVLFVGLLLVAGMIAAVWLKHSLEVSTELESNRYQASMLEAQVEMQKERADILASQQGEASAIRQCIASELGVLAANLENPDTSNEDAFNRAFASVKLLDTDKRWSQNPVVDALVAAKAHQYTNAGIELVANLDVPRDIALPSTDLCAAFANMLDNALAAAHQVAIDDGRATVEVRAHVTSGYLAITTNNPTATDFAGMPESSKHNLSETPISRHGWGLSILRSLAAHYDGDFTFEAQDGTATVTLVLNLRGQR